MSTIIQTKSNCHVVVAKWKSGYTNYISVYNTQLNSMVYRESYHYPHLRVNEYNKIYSIKLVYETPSGKSRVCILWM